ncbi:hypothetical protein GCM10012275_34620 [Longimycelium tulufanense]|uniref:Uncharacterized protein n=1 Tax=Longimycelium tulufanense TaxID=907463 RepID=A0A8J3FV52_9PSEU|nr:hypothetical protein GCM10012275_34620 [Longimycelium tulufanense]
MVRIISVLIKTITHSQPYDTTAKLKNKKDEGALHPAVRVILNPACRRYGEWVTQRPRPYPEKAVETPGLSDDGRRHGDGGGCGGSDGI